VSGIHDNDQRTRYCPRLGHDVPFAYCRSPGSATPCFKAFDCWWEIFDVRAFMTEHCPADALQGMGAPAQPKLASLVDIIRQAQQRARQDPPPRAATGADRSSPE